MRDMTYDYTIERTIPYLKEITSRDITPDDTRALFRILGIKKEKDGVYRLSGAQLNAMRDLLVHWEKTNK